MYNLIYKYNLKQKDHFKLYLYIIIRSANVGIEHSTTFTWFTWYILHILYFYMYTLYYYTTLWVW